jgi:biotin carboxylase
VGSNFSKKLLPSWHFLEFFCTNFCISQSDSIRVMGDKATARETMKTAGVPTVPGSEGLVQVSCLPVS